MATSSEPEWYQSASLSPQAREFLAAVRPPPRPFEFDHFLDGVRLAAHGLSSEGAVHVRGTPLQQVIDDLARSVIPLRVFHRANWDQDKLHGYGSSPYRAISQQSPAGLEPQYVALKSILLGLVLARLADQRTVSADLIARLARFVRQASRDVNSPYHAVRVRLIGMLPARFLPSDFLQVLRQRAVQYKEIQSGVVDLRTGVEVLTRWIPRLLLSNASNVNRLPDAPQSSQFLDTTRQRARARRGEHLEISRFDAPGSSEGDGILFYGPSQVGGTGNQSLDTTQEEAQDSRSEFQEAVVVELPLSTTRVERAVIAARLRSEVRQGFWARYQWDALTPHEMRTAIARLLANLGDPLIVPDSRRHQALVLALLSATLGFSLTRCHGIRCEVDQTSEGPADALDRRTGCIRIPLIGAGTGFRPGAEQLIWLKPAVDYSTLSLPTEVHAQTQRLSGSADGYLFAGELESLEPALMEIFDQIRGDEPRFTGARLARGHQLEVLAQCGDVPLAQMVTGQALGTPPIGVSYYAATPDRVQAVYDSAIRIHGLTPRANVSLVGPRVGSHLVIPDEAIALAVKSLTHGLVNRPRASRISGREVSRLHEEIVRATAAMWLAGTGCRPTFRLGEMRSAAINPMSMSAVVVDKMTNEAHDGRLVPLASTLSRTLGSYCAVLRLLSQSTDVRRPIRVAALHALQGQGSFFFLWDSQGDVRPLTVKDALAALPNEWNLPSNFFRHRIATRLREVGCPGNYVQAFMGHHEMGIDPFGADSFAMPMDYLETTRRCIELVLVQDGWRPLLGDLGALDILREHASPIGVGLIGIEDRIEARALSEFKRQRAAVRAMRSTHREQVDAWVSERVRQHQPNLLTAPSERHQLDLESIKALRRAVCEGAESAALVELRVLALREFLLRGRQVHGWHLAAVPDFFVVTPSPSVHAPSLMPGYVALEQLRVAFLRSLQHPRVRTVGSDQRTLNLVLALTLWQGICSWERLQRVLDGLKKAEPFSAQLCAVAVPFQLLRYPNDPKPERSTEILFGVVALAAVAARAQVEAIDRSTIEDLIGSWLPRSIVATTQGHALELLFTLVRIGHRFESPPPLTMVWTERVLSVGLPLDRLRSLFGLSPRQAEVPLFSADPDGAGQQTIAANPRQVHLERYRWLKSTLRAMQGGSSGFPPLFLGGADRVEDATRRTPSGPSRQALRAEGIRRLETALNQWPEDGSVVRALTAYALARLRWGTPWSSRIEPRTVYRYVTGVGSVLLRGGVVLDLHDLEDDDYCELYAAAISSAPTAYRGWVAAYLAYFHLYLVEQQIAAPVAIDRFAGQVVSLPDLGYVSPNEVGALLSQLHLSSIGQADGDPASARSLAMAAAVALGFAAGTRTSETLLRESRELVTDAGRRALLVRRNRWVGTKSYRSARIVDLEMSMPVEGWHAVSAWLSQAGTLMTDRERTRSALFAARVDGAEPVKADRLVGGIAPILRAITRRPDARVYWWRHTAVSNEFLSLFAEPQVIEAIRQSATARGAGWVLDPDRVRGEFGRSMPLSQAHAAGFRARRGHAQIQTSVSSYVHTANLVEPWYARTVSAALSSQAIATLAGLSAATLRQRTSRANLSADAPGAAIAMLVRSLCPSWPEVVADVPVDLPLVREIETPAVSLSDMVSALIRALRRGDLAAAWRGLHLSPRVGEALSARVIDALGTNAYGLPFSLGDAVSRRLQGDLPRRRVQRTGAETLSLRRPDESWIQACARRCESAPERVEVWRVVLKGIDPRTGIIAVDSIDALVTVLRGLGSAIGEQEASSLTIQVIVDQSLQESQLHEVRGLLAREGQSETALIRARMRVPVGWLQVGIGVVSSRSGRRQIAALATAALVAATCWGDRETTGSPVHVTSTAKSTLP
ncbi:MAG: hypothetical protein IPO08_18060 [Xanthomonadales bacterium]|nr:hypothetical protein [Xanthomonadales bacterium]